MKCPVCGAAELVHNTRNLPYTCDGKAITIPAVAGDYCPACDDGVLGASESARVIAAMLALRHPCKMKVDQLRNDIPTGISGGAR